tara:strand:- start:245 stop:682 length:438 start_codon:yes stop_codon:yes gene_type:complete
MRQEFFEQNLDHSIMRNTPIFKEKDVNNQLKGNGQRTKKYKKGSDFTMVRNPKDDFDLQFNFKQLVCRHSPTGLEFGYGGSGPSDTALNILLNYFSSGSGVVSGTEMEWINSHYHRFKEKYVAPMRREGGVIKLEDVKKFIADNP